MTNCNLRPSHALNQKVLKKILTKKIGSVIFHFFIQGTVWPQIAIHCCASISQIVFPCFRPLKSKYLKNDYMVITHWGFLTITAFKISKKMNIGLKTVMLSK